MPIYAYACAACGHHFDKLQKLSDPDPTRCPDCAVDGQVKRQLTAPAFRLSGSGWYETDFKKDGKRNLAGGEGASSEPKPADKGGQATADAKPAAAKPAEAKPAAAAKPASSSN